MVWWTDSTRFRPVRTNNRFGYRFAETGFAETRFSETATVLLNECFLLKKHGSAKTRFAETRFNETSMVGPARDRYRF